MQAYCEKKCFEKFELPFLEKEMPLVAYKFRLKF